MNKKNHQTNNLICKLPNGGENIPEILGEQYLNIRSAIKVHTSKQNHRYFGSGVTEACSIKESKTTVERFEPCVSMRSFTRTVIVTAYAKNPTLKTLYSIEPGSDLYFVYYFNKNVVKKIVL